MIDLQKDKYIKHLPSHQITREDECCLGYDNSWDFWLVFEEWEFRIYTYEWWSYDSIVDWEHEWEDWWRYCDVYFKGCDDVFDIGTCEYLPVKFENTNPEWMACEIWEATEDLEDNYSITSREWDWPNDKLINFIKEHLLNKIYCYYK